MELGPDDPETRPWRAAFAGNLAALEAMAVDPATRDADGRTPCVPPRAPPDSVHWAAAGGSLEALSWLLARPGAKATTRDETGWTPLHSAVAAGHLDAARCLLGAGADVHARTERGTTPLHHHKGRLELVRLLLQAGARPNDEDELGQTPLHRALSSPLVIEALLRAGAHVDATDAHGAPTSLGDAPGNTALHIACQDKNAEAARALLEAGASSRARNRAGKTPRDLAPSFVFP